MTPPTGTAPAATPPARPIEEVETVVIRFAGDSGDGIQLAGDEFTKAVAVGGSAFSTRPEYPSEIRAPVGTLFGVSAYQIQYSSHSVFTSGDRPDVLVAMNPAALKLNIGEVKPGGIVIANTGAFSDANLSRAGYTGNPLTDDSLAGYRLYPINIAEFTTAALADSGLSKKEVARCRNHFALGLMLWLYHRPLEEEEADVRRRFATSPALADANVAALRAGYAWADSREVFPVLYQVRPAPLVAGTYRSVTGNLAAALGFVTASELSGLRLVLGSYPITPASDILHTLAGLRHFNVVAFQAEDEIAGICSAIGASFGGALGLTTTSGPGMALKTEALSLAVMLELPLVVVNVQRGGPSTGLPTRVEQSDLLQALYGRPGECPVPVIAARSPADCFECALEAVRLAVRYMTPVILLSDGGIGNSSEPWRIPDVATLPPMPATFRTDPAGYQVYARDEHLARAWVRPGTPGMEHRIGGLEKDCLTGNISGDPRNHQKMVELRAAKVAGIARDIPPSRVAGPATGDLLVLTWGSTWGAAAQAAAQAQANGRRVAHLHLRYLNPLPSDLGGILAGYRRIMVPELNLGQLARLIRERYLLDVAQINKVQGRPFTVADLLVPIEELTA